MKKIALLLIAIILFSSLYSQITFASERAENFDSNQEVVYPLSVVVYKQYTSLSMAPVSMIYSKDGYTGRIYMNDYYKFNNLWNVMYKGTLYCESNCKMTN